MYDLVNSRILDSHVIPPVLLRGVEMVAEVVRGGVPLFVGFDIFFIYKFHLLN